MNPLPPILNGVSLVAMNGEPTRGWLELCRRHACAKDLHCFPLAYVWTQFSQRDYRLLLDLLNADAFDSEPVGMFECEVDGRKLIDWLEEELLLRANPEVNENALGADEQFVFRRRGEAWELRFGKEEVFMPLLAGLAYMHELLVRPDHPVISADLMVRPGDPRTPVTSVGEALETKLRCGTMSSRVRGKAEEDLSSIKRELENVRRDKELARAEADWDEFEKMEKKEDSILTYVNARYTPDGREKGVASQNQRAHRAVKKALADVRKRLAGRGCDKLARFLKSHIHAEARACHVYHQPLPSIPWVLT